jgi:hypothetical protein
MSHRPVKQFVLPHGGPDGHHGSVRLEIPVFERLNGAEEAG